MRRPPEAQHTTFDISFEVGDPGVAEADRHRRGLKAAPGAVGQLHRRAVRVGEPGRHDPRAARARSSSAQFGPEQVFEGATGHPRQDVGDGRRQLVFAHEQPTGGAGADAERDRGRRREARPQVDHRLLEGVGAAVEPQRDLGARGLQRERRVEVEGDGCLAERMSTAATAGTMLPTAVSGSQGKSKGCPRRSGGGTGAATRSSQYSRPHENRRAAHRQMLA